MAAFMNYGWLKGSYDVQKFKVNGEKIELLQNYRGFTKGKMSDIMVDDVGDFWVSEEDNSIFKLS